MVLLTAFAPSVWGTTYWVTTEVLPPDRPLLAATVRALPAGLLLLAVTRRLPSGSWWWRSAVLGTFNIGAFFALLFVAAYRLPGGIAAVVGAFQPLIVAALAAALVGERVRLRIVLCALAGIAGVALLVLRAEARLDGIGVLAAIAGACVMAVGVVLAKRWGQPAPLLAVTGWQLVAGGLLLAPLALAVEGVPAQALTTENLLGYLYLCLVGTVLAYSLWFRGVHHLPVTGVIFLGLLSPLVATLIGWLALGQSLGPEQVLGAVLVVAAVVVTQLGARPAPVDEDDTVGTCVSNGAGHRRLRDRSFGTDPMR